MIMFEKVFVVVKFGQLFLSMVENFSVWLIVVLFVWVSVSIVEFVDKQVWVELNDCFYCYLEFGMGGMCGCMIGVVMMVVEMGELGLQGMLVYLVVGSNVFNDFMLVCVIIGFFCYI